MRARSSSLDRQQSQLKAKLRKTDHYEILGVSKDSNDKQIRSAYRKMALLYHPDKNSNPQAKELFKKVADSYNVLTDTNRRAAYDRQKTSKFTTFSRDYFPSRNQTFRGGFPQSYMDSRFRKGSTFKKPERQPPKQAQESSDDGWPKRQKPNEKGHTSPNTKRKTKQDLLKENFDDLLGKLYEALKKKNLNQQSAQSAPTAQTAHTYKRSSSNEFIGSYKTTPKRMPPKLNIFAFLGLFFLLYMAFNSIFSRREVDRKLIQRPRYSFARTQFYSNKQVTPILKTPFYVRPDYAVQIRTNPSIIKATETKVDKQFMIKIRTNCQQAQQLQESYKMLIQQSTGVKRKMYEEQAQEVDMIPCVRLEHIKRKHSGYLKELETN